MLEFLKGTVTLKDWAAVGIILGFGALLILAFYFLLYLPQQEYYDQLVAQDKTLVTDLNTARDRANKFDDLKTEATKMKELVTHFQERLPESQEIPMLVKVFEDFGKEIGLNTSLALLPSIPDERKETFPYSAVAKGNFHQIVTFMNRLESYKRYLKISDLNIGEEKDGVSQATFTLSTFRILQKADKPSGQTGSSANAAAGGK